MSVLTEHLDYSKPVGWSTRAKECDLCVGQGNSNAVQITRKPEGFLAYCFRCGRSKFFPDKNASESQVKKMIESAGAEKKRINRPDVVTLPDDYTTSIPPKGLVQLYNLELDPHDIERYDIGWSPSRQRIIVPVYVYYTSREHGDGWQPLVPGKKLVGIMGRKLDSDPPEKPKWWSQRQRDIKHPRFVGLPETFRDRRTVVIVENCFSAIKVSKATGWLSIALLTSYLPYELYGPLQRYTVHIWLDADAYGKSLEYQAAMGNRGITAHTHVTTNPPKPKDCTIDQIREELGVDASV